MHHTAESSFAVCITPPSLTPPSQYLPSVCFDSKFYKYNFSVTPEDINVKNVLLVKNSLRNLFYFRRFFCKTLLKEKTNMKKPKTFDKKTYEVKKIYHTNVDLEYNFHINIFRHHREIAFVKLRIKTDTW